MTIEVLRKLRNYFLKLFKFFITNMQLKHFLAILGFLLFCGYIWLRFIRTRMPKHIPFTLSILGLILLVYICIVYSYIVISLIRKSTKENSIITQLIKILYKPLEAFDQSWKNISYINSYYNKAIIFLTLNLQYIFKEHYFYILFAIFSRIVLISVLYIDIFYFHKLHYIYKVLFLGIFLFLNRYIIYSLKMWKDKAIVNLNLFISSVTVKYRRDIMSFLMEKAIEDGTYDPNDPDWDLEDEIPPTFDISLKNYIEIETKSIMNNNINLWNLIHTTDLSKNNYYINNKRNSIAYNKEIERLDIEIKSIVNLNMMLEYYNISKNMQEFKNIRILIFSNYLLCWLYILIISLPSLNILHLISIMIYLLNTLKGIEEPFTGELLMNLEPFYQ